MLILPIVIGSSRTLLIKEIKIVLFFFVLSGLASSLLIYGVDLGFINLGEKEITGRNISLFMSHIRYSIVVSFIIILLVFLMINKKINYVMGIFLSLWFINLLFKIASLTAIIGLFFGVIVLLIFSLKGISRRRRIGLYTLGLTIILLFGAF